MPFSEDLSPFFSTAGFAVAATLDGVPVRGIFDAGHELAGVGALGMAASLPRLTLPSAQVPPGVVGATLTVGSATYTVVEHRPDGTGVSELRLEAAS